MSLGFAQKPLSGWGRLTPAPCSILRPESQGRLLEFLSTGTRHRPWIARGLGRSYGDSAVTESGTVLDFTRLNRMLRFDETAGILECEGGVSLADILSVFVPRGFFLPVTPGTQFVTVGGAIAHDVHGKNHHVDGSFSRFVESFQLWTPGRGLLDCSPGENADVFWATVGGAGLTGLILTARIRLRPIETAFVQARYARCANLDAALESMAESDRNYMYSVAWVDCLASKGSLGRSVMMHGNPARVSDLPPALASTPFRLPRHPHLTVPLDGPGFLLNTWSIKAFNTLFYAVNRDNPNRIVDYAKYFYPLDGIQQWNRLYGKRGFIQYQAAFPFDQRAGLVRMLEHLAASRRASFLAVLKCFGDSGPGPLSYPMPGYTLALDIPNRSGLVPFTRELDRILLDHGGRLYLAKDALAEPATVAAMYPRLPEFRRMCHLLDPEGILQSTQSRRLDLTNGRHPAGTQGEPAP